MWVQKFIFPLAKSAAYATAGDVILADADNRPADDPIDLKETYERADFLYNEAVKARDKRALYSRGKPSEFYLKDYEGALRYYRRFQESEHPEADYAIQTLLEKMDQSSTS